MVDSYSEVSEQGQKLGEQAARQAGRLTERARDTASDLAERGRSFLSTSPDSLTAAVQRNPWMAMVAALVVGYVLAQGLRAVSQR